MICPNKNSREWKNLVAKVGKEEAYRQWATGQNAAKGIPEFNMGQIDSLIKRLQQVLPGVSVVVNPDLKASGKVVREGERTARVEINPELLQGDTIIHEFGHVFIDLLGGLENPIIKAGVARLQGSTIEREVRREYAEESKEKQDKEILARAIGIEGVKILSEEKQSAFRRWLNGFFRKLKQLIGIERTEARYLASKLLSEHVQEEELQGVIQEEFYLQKAQGPNYTELTKQEQMVLKAQSIVENKINQLERKQSEEPEDQEILTQLQLLERELRDWETEHALRAFITRADSQLDYINKKFKEYARELDNNQKIPNLNTVKYLRDAAESFDIALLEDIENHLNDPGLSPILNSIIQSNREVAKSYKKLGDKYIVEAVRPSLTIIESIFKRKAELEFVKDEALKKLRGRERVEKLEEFTQKYLQDNEVEIKKATEKYLEDFLEIVQKDISVFEAFVQNPKDISNDIIQTVSMWFDEADYKARLESMDVVKAAEDEYLNYVNYFGKKNDPKDQWEPLLGINEDGSTAARIVSNESKNEKELQKWKEIKQAGGKYKGTPVEEMYDWIRETQRNTDKGYPPKYRLGRNLAVVNKNFYERVASVGILKAIKEGFVDNFVLKKEDTGFGVIEETDGAVKKSLDSTIRVLSKSGTEKRLIPIHFRGDNIEEADRSYDVLSLVVLDAHQSISYKNKFDLTNKVEYVLDRVKQATVYDRGYKNLLKVDEKGQPQVKEGESNVYKALLSLIENRLYDVKMTGDPTVAKIATSIKKYVSITNLFGNYLSGGANLTQGLSMVFVEGAGGKFYGLKNVRKAATKYRKDSMNIAADVGRRQDLSKTNLLIELFNANSADSILNETFSKNNVLKREFNVGLGLAPNSTAEHWAQSVGMYSVLDNIKVKNKDGKYINKQGEVVENREKAMSLDEAYSVGFKSKTTKKTISKETYDGLSEKEKKDYFVGALHLNEKVASIERTEGLELFKISQSIRRVNRELFGNYDKENKSALERTAIGSLVTHMRQWMIPGIYKRWRGLNTVWMRDKEKGYTLSAFRTIRNTELRPGIDLHYNEETQSFEEGMYVSTLRFLSGNLRNLTKLKLSLVSSSWNDLTTLEKQNIHRTITEAALVALAMLTFSMLQGLADDDEDDFAVMLAAFYARRLQAELLTYIDPREYQRTFRSPAVSLNLIEKTVDALMQTVFEPTEVYERGKHKGEYKAKIKWLKTTPFKAMFRDPKETLKWYIN